MNQHSTIMGGSNCAQRIYCPGSYALEQQMPKDQESDYAKQGSLFHAAMEMMITSGADTPEAIEPLLDELEGQELGFGEGWEITREQINIKLRPAMLAWLEIRGEYDLQDWFIEARVAPGAIPEMNGCFGSVDILGMDAADRLHVIDWKFGDGIPVDVVGNYQLGFYGAAALFEDDPEMIEFTRDATAVVMHIVQPRDGANRVYESWETSLDWIEQLIDECVSALEKAKKPDAPIKVGKHCQFCRAKPICPAHAELSVGALDVKPDGMTAVELADILKRATLLRDWCNSVFSYAQSQAEAGAAIPGFKLVKKRAQRKWLDEVAAEKKLRDRRVKVAGIFNKVLKSPAQIEKLHPELYRKTLSKLVESKSSGLTLVDDSDPREAVQNPMALLGEALKGTVDQLEAGATLSEVRDDAVRQEATQETT